MRVVVVVSPIWPSPSSCISWLIVLWCPHGHYADCHDAPYGYLYSHREWALSLRYRSVDPVGHGVLHLCVSRYGYLSAASGALMDDISAFTTVVFAAWLLRYAFALVVDALRLAVF